MSRMSDSLTDSLTTLKYSATQLLTKYKSGALVTQNVENTTARLLTIELMSPKVEVLLMKEITAKIQKIARHQ